MITIIEPHVDDAVQSCCELLFLEEQTVVVNFAGEERSPMSYQLQLNKHVTGLRLELPQIHIWDGAQFSLDDFIYYGVFAGVNYCDARDLFSSYIDILVPLLQASRSIYVPLGIFHPHHILVNFFLSRMPGMGDIPPFTYYYDQPYVLRNPNYVKAAENRLPHFEKYDKISVPTPDIDRRHVMLQCFHPRHLMGYEEQIHESVYLVRQK